MTAGRGFALVAVLLGMVLLAALALAFISISSIELRMSEANEHERRARANARLALVHALGQLQMAMGPDTRVSASSAMISDVGQQHWTGVWSASDSDGRAWIARDGRGSLADRRRSTGYDRRKEVMCWLVSGASGPDEVLADPVEMVGAGSVDDPGNAGVRVPAIDVSTHQHRGRIAWWTGDLAQRADLSQAAPELIGKGVTLEGDESRAHISEATAAMAARRPDWARAHFHDFTVHSQGLLTNTREGGLKKDLSVFLGSSGNIAPSDTAPGLNDSDRLAGPANAEAAASEGVDWESNPLRDTAPRFGVLRHWAGLASAGDDGEMAAVPPESAQPDSGVPETSANLLPVKLNGAVRASIQPILVEASQAYSFTWFRKPGEGTNPHHLRKHIYPKITLWNPYPVPLVTRPMMVLLQINGRHDFWIDGHFPGIGGKPDFPVSSPWISADGGRSRDFVPVTPSLFSSPGFKDPHMGSYYYRLPPTRFAPGGRVVFSPAGAAEYRTGISADGGDFNLASNLLAAGQEPHPSRCLTIPEVRDQLGFGFIPSSITMESTAPLFKLLGMEALRNHGDDVRVILKDAGEEAFVDVESFDRLPQIAFLSGSLQYGAGREPGIPWAEPRKIAIEETTLHPPLNPPNERSRDGLRLRTPSASPTGAMEAILANWNPRAAYSLRSPRETFYHAEGHSGLQNASWGFGIYERFMPVADAASGIVPTQTQNQDARSGLLENGDAPEILFDIPRRGIDLISLGQLQHARVSDLVWHPSRAIGNSLADPRVGLAGTLPAWVNMSGFTNGPIGSSLDAERSPTADSWAKAGRALLCNLPEQGGGFLYDLGYEINHALWDRYFMSGADAARKARFHAAPLANPLPNRSLRAWRGASHDEARADLMDFHRAASHLTVEGAFNVNSVSVDAWSAVLARHRRSAANESATSFPRIAGAESPSFPDPEIRRLAAAMVAEVKQRGPFLGMADFVNRRLADDATGRRGAMEAAIHAAGLNAALTERFPLSDAGREECPPEITQPLKVDRALKPESAAWGTENFLTQADVLQTHGDFLTTRSDTFVIRAYGESLDASGRTQARAWCEAVVQRVPTPVIPGPSGVEPEDSPAGKRFGRGFEMIRFRWLLPAEV